MRQAEQRLRVIRLLLIWQFVFVVVVGCVGLLWDELTAVNALVGGVIAWLPNCYFAYKAFKYRGARAARKIVLSFYSGFAGKLVLTSGLFIAVFVYLKPLNALAVFSGFIVVQFLNWVVPVALSARSTDSGRQ